MLCLNHLIKTHIVSYVFTCTCASLHHLYIHSTKGSFQIILGTGVMYISEYISRDFSMVCYVPLSYGEQQKSHFSPMVTAPHAFFQ